MIKNNKFRINHTSSKHPLPSPIHSTPTLANFFSKAIQAIKDKNSTAIGKFESKLTDTPAVFSVGKDQRLPEQSIGKLVRDRDSSLSKNSEALKDRARSHLTREEGDKLKQLLNRKQELMEKLRKIDYELLNPAPTVELTDSRASAESPFRHLQSRLKIQQSRVYNPLQHEKTIQMLARLNKEKLRRQERIVEDMKKKQEKELQKLNEMENKSHIQLTRHDRPPLIKFNTKESENLAFDRKTNSITESQPRIPEKIDNQFDQLPELVTCQKELDQKDPLEESI